MSNTQHSQDLTRLRALLDVHGANSAKWPAADAKRLASLASSDATARRLIQEAQAFDRALAAAPAGDPGRIAALADRISASLATPAPAVRSAQIVPLPVRRSVKVAAVETRRWQLVPVCGALAASLVIGFYVGTSGFAGPALQQVAGLSATTASAVQSAADDGDEGELL